MLPLRGPLGQLLQHARLADARLAADEHKTAVAGADPIERRVQRAQLGGAAEKHGLSAHGPMFPRLERSDRISEHPDAGGAPAQHAQCMNQIARHHYTRSTDRAGRRGTVLALGIALVLGAGTVAAAVAPADDSTPSGGAGVAQVR